ncbi:uncharacterized protein LOC128185013 [Crassostrea angulata]|uniref:uncharacterized protein LOC128185013 n=1 Tax=Magallana angulata TaxID=2784310 RepID=UPI0022B1F92C|nr:uncharacterized protein LOC128185013 [Crassostrea angulata]
MPIINLKLTLAYMILIFLKIEMSKANGESCPISTKTVQVVEDCPDSLEKWNRAAERKNCTAFATQCDEPKKLQYHCVINTFVNETIEVCAYAQNIVHGHCSEYSISGNMVQRNSRAKCSMFKNSPCPVFYLSTEAYKYPGCYEQTKKGNSLMDTRLLINKTDDIPNTAIVPCNTDCSAKKEKTAIERSVLLVIAIMSTLFNGVLLILVCCQWEKKNDLTEESSLKMRPLSRKETYLTFSRNSCPGSSYKYEFPTTVSRI